MHPLKSFSHLLQCVSLAAIVTSTSGSVFARPEIPGDLQKAAGMSCVPLCTMCHATNPGVKDNWASTLGAALYAPINSEQDITPAYNTWAMANPQLAALVQQGKRPETGADVCGPTYGCAVRLEKEAAAPRDFTGPLWVVGAIVAGGILRRRKTTR